MKTVYLLAILAFGFTSAAPMKEYDENVELHDQRQNGTENYRFDMKDVVIVISPIDTLFSAVSGGSDSLLKPPPESGSDLGSLTFLADLKHLDGNAPEIDQPNFHQRKPVKKWSNSRIGSFIKMFIDRRRLGNLEN